MSRHIGLIGCGGWGRYILRDLKRLGCAVTVAATSCESRARAAEYGADGVVDSIGKLPETVEGFVVATPTSVHAETIEPLLKFQRPIFVEKPLTSDPESARKLVEQGGDRIFVMDKWRYHPGVEALRDIARSDELGPLESIRTLRLGWATPHFDVDASWILMPHDLSIVLEILGYIPDPVLAAAEYANSELTGLLGVLGAIPKVVAEVSVRSVKRVRSVSLSFRRGAALLEDSYSPCIEIRRAVHTTARKDDPKETRAISTELPLLRELGAFVRYLDGGPPPKSSAAEGLRIVEVVSRLRSLANVQAD